MTNIGLNLNTNNMLGLMQMFGGNGLGTSMLGLNSIFSCIRNNKIPNATGSLVGTLATGVVLNYAPQILGKFIGGISSAIQTSRAQKAEAEAADAAAAAEAKAKAEQVTKEEQVTLNKSDIRNEVMDILNTHKIVASEETIKQITDKYPTMQSIQVGNLSVEDRVVNLAKGLESQRQFELISTTVVTNEEMLELQEDLIKSGINSEETINNMLKTGAITQEEANKYIEALNFKAAETPEPIVLDAVNEAVTAGSQEQFNNAYLQYAREQIETYDTNNDGVILFDEFEKVEKEKAGELYDELSTKAIFDTINQNGNDEIDAAEMASLIWATSKINDTETSKSAGDITASEVKTIMDAFTTIGLQANLETLNKNATDEEMELYKEEIIKGLPNASLLKEALKNGYIGFSAE